MSRMITSSARLSSGADRIAGSMRAALAALGLLAAVWIQAAQAAPAGTAFTYQGQIVKNGTPYQGSADLIFRLFNAASGPGQVGSDYSLTGLTVAAGGVISVDLDFGAVFNGTALWLEIQIRTPPDGSYTTLSRQAVTAAPFALYSLSGAANQWLNDANGINYGGLVGIGVTTNPDVKLTVDAGTTRHPMYLTSSHANPCLVIRNFSTNGQGIYDDESDFHYFAGSIGVGTTVPTAKVQAVGGVLGLRGDAAGNYLISGPQCGVYGQGSRGSGQFGGDAAGVIGVSDYSTGVSGQTSNGGTGTTGQNLTSGTTGLLGASGAGVAGSATNPAHYGGHFSHTAPNGVALRAVGLAQVNTLQILGADLAESFPIAESKAEPGTVLEMAEGTDGELRIARQPYSRKVAGVVSGANGLDAGVVLKGARFEDPGHAAVALSGRVWVRCDATRTPIRVGDLLTTSERRGHAMVATDRDRAYGAILGKAMTSLETGTGLVLVLVSLQ
jgi:hypothetical protein